MKIKSIKTQLVHDISAENWESITKRGDAPKYIVISNAPEIKPNELTGKVAESDRNTIVKNAGKLYKAGDLEGALEEYQKANAIKATTLISDKIADIETKINDDPE